MSARRESFNVADKGEATPSETSTFEEDAHGYQLSVTPVDVVMVEADQGALHRELNGRHIQIITMQVFIWLAVVVLSVQVFSADLAEPSNRRTWSYFYQFHDHRYLTTQTLAQLTVMYPINGAFTVYIIGFNDPSLWGFACELQYGIGWLTVPPLEAPAACNVRRILAPSSCLCGRIVRAYANTHRTP